jgi:hypothetical protein
LHTTINLGPQYIACAIYGAEAAKKKGTWRRAGEVEEDEMRVEA